MTNNKLKLGTRSSRLALAQSRQIARLLEKTHRGLRVELVEILTTGDQLRNQPLRSFDGAGVFVKELERALLNGRVDFAAHSLKDLPTRQPRGLTLAAIVCRDDPRDAAIMRHRTRLENLRAGSVIGSGSLRRRAQLKHLFPHLEFAEIRGNIETRIRQVEEGKYAGTILALAGLRRLKLTCKITQVLSLDSVLPAPGQGALALECRASDTRMRRLLKKLHNTDVAACVFAERATLETLGGGCHLPLGALATIEKVNGKRRLHLRATLGLPDGSKLLRAADSDTLNHARALGSRVARKLQKL